MNTEQQQRWVELYAKHISYFTYTRLGMEIKMERAVQMARSKLATEMTENNLTYTLEDLEIDSETFSERQIVRS